MDRELRALVRRLVADPGDHVAGTALARELVRRPGVAPREPLQPGATVLVVRPSAPRPGFAWRLAMDRAIGRTGCVTAVAADGLSVEVAVPGVGRFQFGHASLFGLPELGHDRPPSNDPPPPERSGRSLADLRRIARDAAADVAGEPDAGGVTPALRALLDAIPADSGLPLADVAARAGFVPENNRDVDNALAIIFDASDKSPRARTPLVTIEVPILLPGAVVPGPLDTGAWTVGDLWVARTRGSERLLEGLPWGLLAGSGEAPPHEPTEVADALVKLLDAPRADLDDVLAFLPGPDFPGGGELKGRAAVRALYETGAGTLRLSASIELVLPARLVVETPFADATADVVSRLVSDAVRAGRLEGVAKVHAIDASFHVEVDRDGGRRRLLAVKEALASLLPEQDVAFRLPRPLVPWLRSWLDELVGRSGAREARRRILAARAAAPQGGRRTRLT